MTWIVVDVEADGPAPGLFSMVSFGAVVLADPLTDAHKFYGRTAPISDAWIPEALAVSGVSREEHQAFPDPAEELNRFAVWLDEVEASYGSRLVFASDNPAFDWQFVNYYLWRFVARNPMGHSARRIGDLWAGFQQDAGKQSTWKRMRRTPHTHHPVQDATGMVEGLIGMAKLGLRLPIIRVARSAEVNKLQGR